MIHVKVAFLKLKTHCWSNIFSLFFLYSCLHSREYGMVMTSAYIVSKQYRCCQGKCSKLEAWILDCFENTCVLKCNQLPIMHRNDTFWINTVYQYILQNICHVSLLKTILCLLIVLLFTLYLPISHHPPPPQAPHA